MDRNNFVTLEYFDKETAYRHKETLAKNNIDVKVKRDDERLEYYKEFYQDIKTSGPSMVRPKDYFYLKIRASIYDKSQEEIHQLIKLNATTEVSVRDEEKELEELEEFQKAAENEQLCLVCKEWYEGTKDTSCPFCADSELYPGKGVRLFSKENLMKLFILFFLFLMFFLQGF